MQRIIALPLIGVLIILGACASPVTTPNPEPEGFTVSRLKIPVLQESSGEGVEIGVTVKNNGEEEGTHTLVLKIDGAVAETKDVTLAGGASQYVIFTIGVHQQGTHNVTIEQLSGKLMWPGPN